MRLRTKAPTIRWVGTPSRLVPPSKAAIKANEGSRQPLEIDSQLSSRIPPHPFSNNIPDGWKFKYATGNLPYPGQPSDAVKLRASGVALELTSQLPMEMERILKAFSLALNVLKHPTTDLLSRLRWQCALTMRMAKFSSGVRNARISAVRSEKGLSRIASGNQSNSVNWSLSAEVAQTGNSRDSLTKPLAKLSVPSFFIGASCTMRDTELRVKWLETNLTFHVSPTLLGDDYHRLYSTPHADNGTSLDLISSMTETTLQCFKSHVFSSQTEVVQKLSHALVAFWQSSALAPLVEFTRLEVKVRDSAARQFQETSFFNSDETANRPYRFKERNVDLTKGPELRNTLAHFNDLWSHAPGSGLARYGAAARSFNATHSQYAGVLESEMLNIPTAKLLSPKFKSGRAYFDISFSPGSHAITIHLPEMTNIEAKAHNHDEELNDTSNVKFSFNFKWQDRPPVDASAGAAHGDKEALSTLDELAILSKMTLSIVEKICSEMEFDSSAHMTDVLAKGLLRTVRFPGSDLLLQSVKLKTRVRSSVSEDEVEYAAEAKWDKTAMPDAIISSIVKSLSSPAITNSGVTMEAASNFEADPTEPVEKDAPNRTAMDRKTEVGSSSSSAVESLRTTTSDPEPPVTPDQPLRHNACIAIGSNLGDRFANLERACREIQSDERIHIVRTSALYETEPMYVKDQGNFLNGVIMVRTELSPLQLLDRLQEIEKQLGRVKTIDKGPRNIDLDILLYEGHTVNEERLKIPHPLMMEREFVLRPLGDITATMRGKLRGLTHKNPLAGLQSTESTMTAVTSLGPLGLDLRINDPRRRTQMMSIVNVTPDSFSDGGDHDAARADQLAALIKTQIAAGATIIDVGGQSSRPNAPDVTAEEEIARVVPAIEIIKSIPEAAGVAISVDTYRAAVAEAAVKAGAHIVNDISAGQLDPDMFATVARLGCTYIMMHMRGTPWTMTSEENCSYPEGLVTTVRKELRERLREAQVAGIHRWRIILDPGIGFSKTAEQNAELLRYFAVLRDSGGMLNMAWLVGTSRKSFIGKITGVAEPKDRGIGTAATVTAAIQGGAEIVRVHDAVETAAAVKMADAMYRT